jgi:uncharacterized BrkB/YihY/UPF0761 family membrane protein
VNAERPRRVTVTSPWTRAGRRSRTYPIVREIDEQSEVGALYMRSLMRTQLRLGVLVVFLVCGPLAALPVLFTVLPLTKTVLVLGLPLPWLVLGIAVYPVVVLVACYYVWRVERTEREFADLVEQS